jgi:hypothetical protein
MNGNSNVSFPSVLDIDHSAPPACKSRPIRFNS